MVALKDFNLDIIVVVDSMRTEPFAFLRDCYPVLTVVAMFIGEVVYQAKGNPPTRKARTCTLRYQETVVTVGEVKVVSSVTKVVCEGTVGLLVNVRVLPVFISGIGSFKLQKDMQG